MSISDNAVTYIIMRSPKDHTKQFHYAQRFIHFRERSNIISLKFCLSWTPPISLNYHFRVSLPHYHSLSLASHCILTHFYAFFMRFVYCFSIFWYEYWIVWVVSLTVQSPHPPISVNYYSRSQPRPLLVSDMICERSLTVVSQITIMTFPACHRQ